MVVESPLAGDVVENVAYARKCLGDSLERGEAPFASHVLYPGTLDDSVPEQRMLGMRAGFAWGERADLVAVYVDRGVSAGMFEGIARAVARGMRIEFRSLVRLSDDAARELHLKWAGELGTEGTRDASPRP